jgi:hypothetical protein
VIEAGIEPTERARSVAATRAFSRTDETRWRARAASARPCSASSSEMSPALSRAAPMLATESASEACATLSVSDTAVARAV